LNYAPIAIFAYRRVRHLEQTLRALAACPEFAKSAVYVFSDGPANGQAVADVAAVRRFLAENCTPNMTIVEAPGNLGLAASITYGVTQLCNEFGRVIVIEDDIIAAPCLLTWFNRALDQYQSESDVWQVSGFQFPVPEFRHRNQGVFLHLVTSWGWATWRRAWDRYDPDATGWQQLRDDASLRDAFDLGGGYPHTKMLFDQMEGRIDSWAIRWRWSAFKAHGLALYPPRTLVQNIGFDATATHTRYRWIKRLLQFRRTKIAASNEPCPELPLRVEGAVEDDKTVSRAIKSFRRLSNRLKTALAGA